MFAKKRCFNSCSKLKGFWSTLTININQGHWLLAWKLSPFFYKKALYKSLQSRSLLDLKNPSRKPEIFKKRWNFSENYILIYNRKICALYDNWWCKGNIQWYHSKVEQYRVLGPDGLDNYITLTNISWVWMIMEDWKTCKIYWMFVLLKIVCLKNIKTYKNLLNVLLNPRTWKRSLTPFLNYHKNVWLLLVHPNHYKKLFFFFFSIPCKGRKMSRLSTKERKAKFTTNDLIFRKKFNLPSEHYYLLNRQQANQNKQLIFQIYQKILLL